MKTWVTSKDEAFVVSDEDFDYIKQFDWHLTNGYIARTVDDTESYLHIEILNRMGITVSNVADHKNREKLNNCRDNLRSATFTQNCANKAKQTGTMNFYKGTNCHPNFRRIKRWRAILKCKGVTVRSTYYLTEEEAARKYDEFAQIYFGDFAVLNFPRE